MNNNLGFKSYHRNNSWYAGKLTKKNFDEVVAFIQRCNGGEVIGDKTAGTIKYTRNFLFNGGQECIVKLGDYVARNVGGGDNGEVLCGGRRWFKENYTENQNYRSLAYYDLTDVEYNVLRSIVTHDTECFYGYKWIMDYTNVDRNETKKATVHLRELGILSFSNGLMNDDGEVGGSGYGFSTPMQELLAELLMRRKQDKPGQGFDPDMEVSHE